MNIMDVLSNHWRKEEAKKSDIKISSFLLSLCKNISHIGKVFTPWPKGKIKQKVAGTKMGKINYNFVLRYFSKHTVYSETIRTQMTHWTDVSSKVHNTSYTISKVDKKMHYSKITTAIMTNGFMFVFIKTENKN